jgi:hypothetical protein
VFSKAFLRFDAKDAASIFCVSKKWKADLESVQEELWESLVIRRHSARLAAILRAIVSPSSAALSDRKSSFWRNVLRTKATSEFVPRGLNRQLQADLETVFRPLGIVAFSTCCNYACSGSYNEDGTFLGREDDGIYYIRLHLDGMNFNLEPVQVAASYGSWEYLDMHWDTECQMLAGWCAVLGLKEGDYTIMKPESIKTCVLISLKKHPELEDFVDDELADDGQDVAVSL